MIEMEFDHQRAYGDVVFGENITYEDYLTVPIVRWCIKNIGPLHWPISPGDSLSGEGWEVYADWSLWMSAKFYDRPPRTVLLLTDDVDSKLLTEFWIKFGI